MAMPRTTKRERRGKENIELLLKVVRDFYEGTEGEGPLTQKEIVEKYDEISSQSTVSRMLDEAKERHIVRTLICPPRHYQLEEEIREQFGQQGNLRHVSVVPAGYGKNIRNLGSEAAEVLIQAILSVLEKKDKDEVRLTMACGATLETTLSFFFDQATVDFDLLRRMKEKRFNMYPAAVYASDRLDFFFPTSLITLAAVRMRDFLSPNRIEAHIPYLPSNFYGLDVKARKTHVKKSPLEKTLQEAAEADIVLLGIGADSSEYRKLLSQFGVVLNEQDFIGEINYIPIREDGTEVKDAEDKLVALSLDELRKIAKQEDKHVIAISGGEEKGKVIRAAMINPVFNTLVTDEKVANFILGLD